MGRGVSKVGGSNATGGRANEIKGDVSFAEIVKASNNIVSFNKVTTISPEGYMSESGKKNDLGALLEKYNITEFVGNMYRDKSGANDLKRVKDLGFEVQARYLGESQGGYST